MERGQKEQELKYEVLVTINDDRSLTACVSANGHRDHFSKALGIMRGDGATVHSACAGFGLARMALALLRWHGPSMSTWPSSARAFLGDPGFGSCRGRRPGQSGAPYSSAARDGGTGIHDLQPACLTSMTTDEIAELLALVKAELEQPDACPEDLWREPCEWDSTTLVNIIFVAEEHVHITLTAEQMDCVRGLRSLIAMIDDAARLARTPA